MASTRHDSSSPANAIDRGGARVGCAVEHPAARAMMQSAVRWITLGSTSSERLERLEEARDRWLGAGSKREVIVSEGPFAGQLDNWVAVFVEDDKGLLSVSGQSREEALERGLALLGAPKARR